MNKQVDELTWKISRSRALDYLRTREKLFVVDAYAGWDQDTESRSELSVLELTMLCS